MQCISWKSRWRLAQGRASLLSLGIRALTALAIMTKKQQESDTWLCFRLKESVSGRSTRIYSKRGICSFHVKHIER